MPKCDFNSVTFSKVAGFQSATLLKVNFLHGFFSRFLNCTYGTKLRNASHICENTVCIEPIETMETRTMFKIRPAATCLLPAT